MYRREGDQHVVGFSDLKLELRISRVHFGDAIRGWLEVRSEWPQDRQRLFRGEWNMSGPRARSEMVKNLQVAGKVKIDWDHVLAEAYDCVLDAVEEGTQIVKLTDIPEREGSKFEIEPIAFHHLPVIWFGRGGSGKSTLVAAAAIALHANVDILGVPLVPGAVLINDWETDGPTYRDQVSMICAGHGIVLPDISYRECSAPLVRESEAIARYIMREGIANTFNDSLGMAAGGDKNSQEIATGMFGAMRSWGTTNMLVDHIAKDEKTNTPYGSVYFENAARATWRAKGHMKEGSNEHFLSLELEKSNLGRFPGVYFKFTFLPDANQPQAITIERIMASAMPREMKGEDVTAKLNIRAVFVEARRALNVSELTDLTGIPDKSLRQRLSEMEKVGAVVKVIIHGSANKWALKSALNEDGVVNLKDYVESHE